MKMKAAVLVEAGKPLELMELSLPALQPGQVLVKVAYSGFCHSQLMELSGQRGPDRYLPHLLGHEASGVVVDVGAGVSKVGVDDQVVLTWIKSRGLDVQGPVFKMGERQINAGPVTTFSDYTIVSENRCVKLTEKIPLDIAALFGCAVLTGGGVVMNTINPGPASSVFILGLGGIGMNALMAASLCGCHRIIAADVCSSKLSLAKQLGATDQINCQHADVLAEVKSLTQGQGVDYAIEAAGKAVTIETAFSTVKKNGGLCVFVSHPRFGDHIRIDPFDLICGKKIQGSWGGDSQPDNDIPLFSSLFNNGKFPLDRLATKHYQLEEINHAVDYFLTGTQSRLLLAM